MNESNGGTKEFLSPHTTYHGKVAGTDQVFCMCKPDDRERETETEKKQAAKEKKKRSWKYKGGKFRQEKSW